MKRKYVILALATLTLTGVGLALWKGVFTDKPTAATPPSDIERIDPKTIGKVVKEAGTGKEFISNQVIVEFDVAVPEKDAIALIESEGGVMEQRFTAVPLFLVRVDDPGDGSVARATVKRFASDPRVKRAELNYLTVRSDGQEPLP